MTNDVSRRSALKFLYSAGIGVVTLPFSSASGILQSMLNKRMLKRTIPSSAEQLPVVGLGTWQQFDVGTSNEEQQPLREVITQMAHIAAPMRPVIESSPMYGRSEEVVGDLTTELAIADKFFFATKVWTTGEKEGIDQMNASMRKMRRSAMDLMQIHNLVDWQTHLKTLKRWKEEGKIRYVGITHYTISAHDELERIVKKEKVDFVQFNYSLRVRNAERSLLNAAMDHGVAVIINEPYEKGSLFSAVRGKPLPEWAAEYDINSWGQFFLKFILSHPAVTCVIPGTSNPKHLVDNMGAGFGRLPDEQGRKKMIEFGEQI
ncbi:MAG: aldo/keto reductase [Ignavibacteriales bacterium]|nr:aldo/keto reductase [Ignavibacteriales bacterium]